MKEMDIFSIGTPPLLSSFQSCTLVPETEAPKIRETTPLGISSKQSEIRELRGQNLGENPSL